MAMSAGRTRLVSVLVLASITIGAGCARHNASDDRVPAATIAPYGTWSSPLSAEQLARAAIAMSDLRVYDGRAYWRESRPEQGGRQLVMLRGDDGIARPLTPEDTYVRTRVHEYGGASFVVLGEDLVFSRFDDQRLYLQRAGLAPMALTPPGYQYADCVGDPQRRRLLCVREDHTPATLAANGEERNEIVAIALPTAAPVGDDPGRVLVTDSDFVAYPRLSPDGRRLVWLSWNHPDMPWDSATLSLAGLDNDGIVDLIVIAGGVGRAPLEPHWDRDGSLYFIDDPEGWWNLYRWREGRVDAVAPMTREFGGPLWALGESTYALTGDGRAVVRTSRNGIDRLGVLDLNSGALDDLKLPFVAYTGIGLLDAGTAVTIAYSATDEAALIAIDLSNGIHRVLHQPVARALPPAMIAHAEAIEFPTAPGPDGVARSAHAFYYPPTNANHRAADREKPPLIVLVHGGPTSVSKSMLNLTRQFWTTRGFALVDVNYGGSTTFGRAYRQRLNGQWGVVDVQDALAAVDHLVAAGRVDPARVAIRGGSAGGYTVLAALAFGDRFKAGANYFGVSDIQALAATSHKFERHYDVSLVGPPSQALYRERSPIHHLDGFDEPLITFQGSEDKIVPPAQSRTIVAALRERGVPVAYIEFAGEQHGFRKAETIIRSYQAELYFYGRIFGFTPAGVIEPVAIDNLPASD